MSEKTVMPEESENPIFEQVVTEKRLFNKNDTSDSKVLNINSSFQSLDERRDPSVLITGDITAPGDWYDLRKGTDTFVENRSHLIIDRDRHTIRLVCSEKDHEGTVIDGIISGSRELGLFPVNTGDRISLKTLSNLIRKYRRFMGLEENWTELCNVLNNFTSKVDTTVERNSDTRGNDMSLYKSVVETNAPKSFVLCLPIFKGEDPVSFTVEIDVHVIERNNILLELVSIDLNEMLDTHLEYIFNREKARFQEDGKNVMAIIYGDKNSIR